MLAHVLAENGTVGGRPQLYVAGQAENRIGWAMRRSEDSRCPRLFRLRRHGNARLQAKNEPVSAILAGNFIALLCYFGLCATVFHRLNHVPLSLHAKRKEQLRLEKKNLSEPRQHAQAFFIAMQRLSLFTVDISRIEVGYRKVAKLIITSPSWGNPSWRNIKFSLMTRLEVKKLTNRCLFPLLKITTEKS